MSLPSTPRARPGADIPEALPARRHARADAPPGFLTRVGLRLVRLAGVCWRWLVGAVFCAAYFPGLTYLTATAVTGWTYRWVQARVLRGWWKQSRLASEGTFEEFLATLGPGAPA